LSFQNNFVERFGLLKKRQSEDILAPPKASDSLSVLLDRSKDEDVQSVNQLEMLDHEATAFVPMNCQNDQASIYHSSFSLNQIGQDEESDNSVKDFQLKRTKVKFISRAELKALIK